MLKGRIVVGVYSSDKPGDVFGLVIHYPQYLEEPLASDNVKDFFFVAQPGSPD